MRRLGGFVYTNSGIEIKAENEVYKWNVALYFTGEIYVLNKIHIDDENKEILYELYCKEREKIFDILEGDFSLCIFDMLKEVILIGQGEFTSSDTMYYITNDMGFNFDIDIKNILKSVDNRRLNYDVIKEFILQGFIGNKHTLVEGIYKINNGNILMYDIEKGTLNEMYLNINSKYFKKTDNSIDSLIFCMKNNINSFLKRADHWGLALSSGYDSNFLLYLLDKCSSDNIVTLTVGGKKGKNEIEAVKNIVNNYGKVTSLCTTVSSNILDKYPDIIWKLGGAIFEKGIFLDYALVELAHTNNLKTIIMGEGSDEVANWEIKLNYLKYNIMKKSTCFFRAKNIEVIRPFLYADVWRTIYNLPFKERDKKKYLKQIIAENLKPQINHLLVQRGGSVDYEAVVTSNQEFVFLEEMIFGMRNKKDYVSYIMSENIGSDLKQKLGVMYLFLFEKLFLSKEFDYMFAEKEFDLDIKALC